MRKLIIVLTVLFAACGSVDKGDENAISEYELMTVQRGGYDMQTEYAAQINGKTDIMIVPRIEGYLQDVKVKEGANVRKGQLLFVIDQVAFRSAVRSAQSAVMQAAASMEKAKQDYEAKKKLYDSNLISDFDLSQTKRDYDIAEAHLNAAKAELDAARNNLSFTELRSPSDGVVGRIPYRRGDFVAPTFQEGLTMVSDNSEMYVYFSLGERHIMDYMYRYGSMQNAIDSMPQPLLRLSNGEIYAAKGKIESISGVVESSTGAVSVRAVFPNPERLLLSGSTGRIIMPNHIKNAIIIPLEATFELLDKTYVYKVVNGKASSVIVEVEKINDGKQVVVNKGLEVGDVIIKKGAGLVQEGTRVKEIKQKKNQ